MLWAGCHFGKTSCGPVRHLMFDYLVARAVIRSLCSAIWISEMIEPYMSLSQTAHRLIVLPSGAPITIRVRPFTRAHVECVNGLASGCINGLASGPKSGGLQPTPRAHAAPHRGAEIAAAATPYGQLIRSHQSSLASALFAAWQNERHDACTVSV
jgi:hypothetical protein